MSNESCFKAVSQTIRECMDSFPPKIVSNGPVPSFQFREHDIFDSEGKGQHLDAIGRRASLTLEPFDLGSKLCGCVRGGCLFGFTLCRSIHVANSFQGHTCRLS